MKYNVTVAAAAGCFPSRFEATVQSQVEQVNVVQVDESSSVPIPAQVGFTLKTTPGPMSQLNTTHLF